jgi:hypothetical protein
MKIQINEQLSVSTTDTGDAVIISEYLSEQSIVVLDWEVDELFDAIQKCFDERRNLHAANAEKAKLEAWNRGAGLVGN